MKRKKYRQGILQINNKEKMPNSKLKISKNHTASSNSIVITERV